IQHNFAGKLVSQIRGFFKGKSKDENSNTIVKPLFSFNGRVTIGADAILEMCRKLLELRNHVRKIRSIDIETDEDRLSVSVEIDLNLSGHSALSIARTLQRKIRMGLSYFTGMDIRQVNIRVNEIFL
ncbi:MAG: Asp23/Gls24 family envelope stress response protein, partial [Synergistaceae bacterium]|nr:Asp23/Gls24 family envelope stress response protein [Synergistaceae bacterium]